MIAYTEHEYKHPLILDLGILTSVSIGFVGGWAPEPVCRWLREKPLPGFEHRPT
jgi:hypothetical protein